MPKPAAAKTRDLARTRSEILDAAFMEIYANGFQGVSVDKILARTGLTKGAFFHQFPTKLDLGYALVDEVLRDLISSRWIEPLRSYDNPVKGILALMNIFIGKSTPAQMQCGCPLNNLVQEMTNVDAVFAEKLSAQIDFWVAGIEEALKRGIKSGHLKTTLKTKEAALYIVMFHEGLYGFLKAQPDPKVYKSLYSVFRQQLETYCVSD